MIQLYQRLILSGAIDFHKLARLISLTTFTGILKFLAILNLVRRQFHAFRVIAPLGYLLSLLFWGYGFSYLGRTPRDMRLLGT